MIAVITGDVVHSQKTQPELWLPVLKTALARWGNTPGDWEIFRGDSFQLVIENPALALDAAIQIKAEVKQIKKLNLRLAIGLGERNHQSETVSESNGTAFVYSGNLVEELKKNKLTLALRSSYTNFDKEINLNLKLASIFMDGWTESSAKMVSIAMQNPEKLQAELGRLLEIKQNTVSARLKRACYYEIMEVIQMYRFKIATL